MFPIEPAYWDSPLRVYEGISWLKTETVLVSGGFSFSCWIADARGTRFRTGYLTAGHKLLRENAEKQRYVFCVTASKSVSERLGIPDYIKSHVDEGSWFDGIFPNRHLIERREQKAELSLTERRVASLLVLGKTVEEIGAIPYSDNPSPESVRDHLYAIGQKLKKAGYIAPKASASQARIMEVLRTHLYEMRPAVVWHWL